MLVWAGSCPSLQRFRRENPMSEETAPAESGGGGKKKLIIIVVAVVILLVIGGIIAFFLLSGKKEEAHEEPAAVSHEVEPLEHPAFMDLGVFIANLKDGRRYLKTKVQLMVSEHAAVEYLTLRTVEVKDLVLSELQEVSVEEIKQPEQREELKQRLITKISKLLPPKPEWKDPEPIKKVLFEEFYIQ